jgi:hypothetical protein
MDAGFSYDDIVSIPEAGLELEDVGHRSSLTGSLRDSVVGPLSNLLAPGSWGLGYRIESG